MSTTLKIILSCVLGLALTVLISRCKSPTPQAEQSTAPSEADTTGAPRADTAARDTSHSAPAPVKASHQVPLTLVIKNLRSATASVEVGLYGTQSKFPDPKGQLKVYHFKPHGMTLTAEITDQPFGTYALAIFQDIKGTGSISKNFIGIPTEPYAFSNNYIPKTKAPNFSDCQFEYNKNTNSVTMTMIK